MVCYGLVLNLSLVENLANLLVFAGGDEFELQPLAYCGALTSIARTDF